MVTSARDGGRCRRRRGLNARPGQEHRQGVSPPPPAGRSSAVQAKVADRDVVQYVLRRPAPAGRAAPRRGRRARVTAADQTLPSDRVLDVTDHASGTSPYFEAAKK